MRRLVLPILIVLLAVVASAALWNHADYIAPGPKAAKGDETVVLIPEGQGLSRIAETLKKSGVIESAFSFRWSVRLRGEASHLKAGEYAFPSRASMVRVVAILKSGKAILHKLTIAEGLTSQMAYDLIADDTVLTGKAGPVPPEGALLPETYLFMRGTTRRELIARMEAAQKTLIAKYWPKRAENLPVATPEEAIILASIVEKETALPEERRRIAAVFENRLRIGMRLQSDPTIIYGITKGYPLGRGIRESELYRATAYNTYAISGLPPTPICNPGADSIKAVLDPMKTKDLYFVANGTGGHVFAATIAQHRRNVARWRRIEAREKHHH
jgi:UPF0755 protein